MTVCDGASTMNMSSFAFQVGLQGRAQGQELGLDGAPCRKAGRLYGGNGHGAKGLVERGVLFVSVRVQQGCELGRADIALFPVQ